MLTMAAVNMAVSLPAIGGPAGRTVVGMGVLYLIYLVVVGMVVKASRNPLSPSKLSSDMALNPEPLRAQGPMPSDAVAHPTSPFGTRIPPTEEPTSAVLSDDLSLQEVIEARPAELARSAIQTGWKWFHPLPLRLFQTVVVALILFQLHRIAMLFFGSPRRFNPFTNLPASEIPWMGLADTVAALIAVAVLFTGLVRLAAGSEFNLDYWLRALLWLAVGWGALAGARGLLAAYLDATHPVSFSYLSSDYVFLMFADVVKAALCLVVRKAWASGSNAS